MVLHRRVSIALAVTVLLVLAVPIKQQFFGEVKQPQSYDEYWGALSTGRGADSWGEGAASSEPAPAAVVPSWQQLRDNASSRERELDQAFEDWYHPLPGCHKWQSDQQMAECVNHKMRAKREFTARAANGG